MIATSRQHPTIQARPGPPLGEGALRIRPTGRIGGAYGTLDGSVRDRLAEALGPRVQLLFDTNQEVVADFDCCLLEGRSLATAQDWREIIDSGRLAEVTGAFAFAWYDSDGTLHLARDGIGERTLFYSPVANGLVFASSLRALLATGLVARRVNVRAVARYLCYAYLPGRETLAEGVYELLPGEHLQFGRDGLQSEPFWELPTPALETATEEDQAQRLRHTLEDAVRRLLPADEPVGAFLSGGLDSSLVVALARQLHSAPVLSYSVSFGSEYANELPFSSLVADHCGTDHRIVELSPAAVLHHLDESIGLLGDPIGDPLTVPNSLLFREAAAQVGVVLNGEGGDPSFGGPKNLPMLLSELYPGSSDSRAASYLRAHLKCYDDLPRMLAEPVREAIANASLEAEVRPLLYDSRRPDFIACLQALNIRFKGGHHILPKVDALSFPSGVLPRAPLFDRAVVEQSLAIPARMKLRGSVEKYLLKRAVNDLLPQSILDRPKSGMLVPVEGWFRGPLLPAARERLLDGLTPFGLFRRDYLVQLLNGKLGGLRPRHGAKIWLLVTLESWLRQMITSTQPSPTARESPRP